MGRIHFSSLFALLFLLGPAAMAERHVSLSVHPQKVIGHIDERIYGHFFEHIYHSANGGLWGEMVWNRSFEVISNRQAGQWSAQEGVLQQESLGPNIRLLFGSEAWRDYEFTLEAKKTGGSEGFLIMLRANERGDFYWGNLGGWNNVEHGLEKGGSSNNWDRVGTAVKGSIETGRWYRIRIRCEGPRIQIWLDGAAIIDFVDQDHPHLAGKVGVGTWTTRARFRHIQVRCLDGTELFSGLPEIEDEEDVAQHWQSYGGGQIKRVTSGLNDDWCQKIFSCEKSETGLSQAPFFVEKDQTYHGSLWARGEACDGLIVSLKEGNRCLAEEVLAAPTGQWQTYPFALKAKGSANDATLQVGVRGPGEIWLDQVTLMSDSARKAGGFRPDLLQAVADLRPPIIRWPGGAYACFYRWKSGVGPQHKRKKYPRYLWGDQDVNSLGTDEFIALCRRVGAEPLIVVNVGSEDQGPTHAEFTQEARDWVEYCNGPVSSRWGSLRAAHGHPQPYQVKYWEIDNEIWAMGLDLYCKRAADFAAAMKTVDPTIEILVVGGGEQDMEGENLFNGLPWDTGVVQKCGGFADYISLHFYERDHYDSGPGHYEAYFELLAKRIGQSPNPNLKIYCSEWNTLLYHDMRSGLYAGGLLNVFERQSNAFKIGGPALFLRHVSARDWNNAFINFDHRRWFPGCNYVVMKLWRDHYAPDRIALFGDTDKLNVVATRSRDKQRIFVKAVNPSAEGVWVQVDTQVSFPLASAKLQCVAPGSLTARNSLDNPDAVRAEPRDIQVIEGAVRFKLPAWSAGVATLVK